MDAYATLEADLRVLEQKWERITDAPESPRSLMDVIEYSLGSQKETEVYANRLLAYFLDPEEQHRTDTEFLRTVLDGLPDECAFQEDIHDLSDVVVDDQVQVSRVGNGTTETSEIADLLSPNAQTTGIKDDMLVASYDIEVDDDQSFFDAYIESLNEAVVDVVENGDQSRFSTSSTTRRSRTCMGQYPLRSTPLLTGGA